ncbi:MAG: DUF2062 domain-containing protein [Terracidiphilus sp.]|jgi:uncharacterized protein (DUF2062 family)
MKISESIQTMKRNAATWLRHGISPQRLALTLALGFAIGCIPVLGVTTALCVVVALGLRLNFPVIQAANWAAAPLQFVLIVPFVRLGGRMFAFSSGRVIEIGTLLHTSPMALISHVGGMFGQALLAWLLISIPTVALMTAMLTTLLRRVPALAQAESGD